MIPLSLIVLAIIGIVVIGAVALVVIVLTRHQQQTVQAQARAQEFIKRQEGAVWAPAMVISARGGVITGSDASVSQWARYELSLQVTPPSGAPYSAHTTWLVEVAQMSMLQQGQQLSVKIDQQDPQIIYPNASWAKYIPA